MKQMHMNLKPGLLQSHAVAAFSNSAPQHAVMIIATFVFAALSANVITIFSVAQPINVATIIPSLQLQLYSLSLNALRWFHPYLFTLTLAALISVCSCTCSCRSEGKEMRGSC